MTDDMKLSIKALLEEISKGAGPFDHDPLKHAHNCVEQAKHLALRGLAAIEVNDPNIITTTLEDL